MKTLRTSLFTALGLGALASVASANAFNINEHDARVTGRGGASAASNEDPSAIVFNPGGIALGEGTNIAIGSSLYIAQGSYESDSVAKTKTDSSPALVPNIFVTSRVHDMIAIGVGFHAPFGLAVSWPDNHAQESVVQDQSLKTYFITAAVGLNLYKQIPGLSLGGGVDVVPATIELESVVEFGDAKGTAHLGGSTVGVGFRAGAMYHPPAVPGLKFGAMYRSKVKIEFEGDGDFDIADPFRGALPPDGPITATVTLPQTVAGGVAYSPVKNLEIEANAVWINWKQTFADGDLTINLPGGAATVQPQDYKNTVSYRLGVEYGLPAQKMALRAGFIYDPTPIPDNTVSARLPDIDRKNVTVGASKYFGDYSAHLGVLWVTPGERDSTDAFNTQYGVQALVISLGLNGTFGAHPKPAPAGEPA
ncbi:MAG: outer membrane protein transport protein, partial [Kofleriaceae bacterium]